MEFKTAGMAPLDTGFHHRHGTGANAQADQAWCNLADGFDDDGGEITGYCIDAPQRISAGATWGGHSGRAVLLTWQRDDAPTPRVPRIKACILREFRAAWKANEFSDFHIEPLSADIVDIRGRGPVVCVAQCTREQAWTLIDAVFLEATEPRAAALRDMLRAST